MNRPATWKVLTLGVALTGLGAAGAGFAAADDGGAPAKDVRPISVSATDAGAAPGHPPLAVDLSPESADSPFESSFDSVDSPLVDSPLVDSPLVDSPLDSPDDAGYVAPPVAGNGVDSPGSPDSPFSADSPPSPDSPDSPFDSPS
jgi:hypothetical protein